MFAVMNKKWMNRGLILGTIVMIAYIFLELFFWGYLAERRFLKEEKIATTTYFENKNTFDEIRLLSDELSNYDLILNGKEENYLRLNLKKNNAEENTLPSYFFYHNLEFSQGPIDTFINGEKWSVEIEDAPNDTAFQETLLFFKNNFIKFEKIRDGIKQINSTRISSKKAGSINIQIKGNICEELAYSFYYFDIPKNPTEYEPYYGERIDEHFFFNHCLRNDLFCCNARSSWMVPESRFE